VAALGFSKILMGWPLQLAALAGMVWLLARNRTPVVPVDADEQTDARAGDQPQAARPDPVPGEEPA
jgi:hypothetical protein